MAIAALVAQATATSCDGTVAIQALGAECCVADPVQHDVTLRACADDAHCFSGTVCTEVPRCEGGAPCGYFASDWPHASDAEQKFLTCYGAIGSRVCAVPATRSGNRQALTKGFRVGSFSLERVATGQYADRLAFTWKAPDGAEVVHCALFACRPAVRETVRDDQRHRDIANYQNCVLAKEIFQPASGIFDLTNPALAFEPRPPKPADACVEAGPRRISELAVGCWAYDTTELIAATPMEVVDGRGMYNFQDAFAPACDSPAEGKACFLGGSERIGACHSGQCRELCVDNADCSRSDIVAGEPTVPELDADEASDGWSDALPPDAPADAPGPEDSGVDGLEVPPFCLKTDSYIGFCVPASAGGDSL